MILGKYNFHPIFVLFFLTVFLSTLAIIIVNISIQYICSNCVPTFTSWTVNYATYSDKYIFWQNSFCTFDCKEPLEEISTTKVTVFNKHLYPCYKILFVGDSFTVSSGITENNSYAEKFSYALSRQKNRCVKVIRLATGGSGNDQQFARFTDTISLIKPDMVIWQFYYNDFYENATYSLYQPIKTNGQKDIFIRKKPFFNALLWAGIINQHVPMVADSPLGKLLMYIGERKDIFHKWNHLVQDKGILIKFNTEKITYFVKKMHDISIDSGFEFITTLAPLECEVLSYDECEQAVIQSSLRKVLKKNTSYFPMDELVLNSQNSIAHQIAFPYLTIDFKIEEEPYATGWRHLTEIGNQKAGTILYLNYMNK